mmetsp:Transcript_30753/g.53836  ORF Transcript_30753/g.53836 Transcript_30753/m.53836 type:complete len:297 (+) Transcript_30753:2961-3851(+)
MSGSIQVGSFSINFITAASLTLGVGALYYYLTRPVGELQQPPKSKPKSTANRPKPPGKNAPPTLAKSHSVGDEHKSSAEPQASPAVDPEFYNEDGKTLKKEAMIKIISSVGKLHRKHISDIKQRFTKTRREKLAAGNLAAYKESVAVFHKEMQSEFEQTCNEVLAIFSIPKLHFTQSMSKYSHDHEVAAELKNMNNDSEAEPVSWPADLTVEKLKEIIEYEAEITQARGETAEIATAADVTLVMAQIEDEIYQKFNIEYDEKLAAFKHFEPSNVDLKKAMRTLSETQQKLQRKRGK